jgi:CubicO group peptidase (beta-lactamase class C family)
MDATMAGFPPAGDTLVTLGTWQDPPNVRWAFRHMRELIPTHPISAGDSEPRLLETAPRDVGAAPVTRLDGSSATVDQVLAETFSDALIILHDGRVITEQYSDGMAPSTRHLVMSVSKSIVGCVAGILVSGGVLDPDAPVASYVPEIGRSGYGGSTVRHLLDMRTGVQFRETYTEIDAEVRVMERSMGWRPRLADDPIGAYAYLTTLGTATRHGGDFTYRSADTDMLGWVCERASGTRMADLISSLIWQPMGAEYDAEITCDAVGSAIHDGGVSATIRDLARFGQLLLDDGVAQGRQIIPSAWLQDARTPTPDVRQAFARSDNEPVLPGGWYRNQFWFVPGLSGEVLLCLGIHGQLIHVDRATRTVAVKLSSWPEAQNAAHLIDTLRACGAIGERLT